MAVGKRTTLLILSKPRLAMARLSGLEHQIELCLRGPGIHWNIIVCIITLILSYFVIIGTSFFYHCFWLITSIPVFRPFFLSYSLPLSLSLSIPILKVQLSLRASCWLGSQKPQPRAGLYTSIRIIILVVCKETTPNRDIEYYPLSVPTSATNPSLRFLPSTLPMVRLLAPMKQHAQTHATHTLRATRRHGTAPRCAIQLGLRRWRWHSITLL